jgi:quinoprotein dehydrogenase-associated probable ABC transporter substrate-binding protein
MCSRFLRIIFVVAIVSIASAAERPAITVCADPDNLPYSNQAQQGFENHIARLMAQHLHRKLEYQWSRMGRGFVREFLTSHQCDVLIEVPTGLGTVLSTRPYFASSYMFVSRRGDHLALSSFDDAALSNRKIGVQVLPDDYAPPGLALTRRGMLKNIVGFDSHRGRAGEVIRAVAQKKIDVAIVWGPVAGYYAWGSKTPLQLNSVPAVDPPALPMVYQISMGVRKGDVPLRDALSEFLTTRKSQIQQILNDFHVPFFDPTTSTVMAMGKRE